MALAVAGSRIRELSLLSRDDMVSVIRVAGLGGPSELVREIVNQAEGRPGLAVTLAHLCLEGEVKDVALGEAISRSILSDFQRLVGPRSAELLAAFAIGGDSGMRLDVVAQALGLSLPDVRTGVAGLAAGGVITEARTMADGSPTLAVRPKTLRHALVRDFFFNSPARIPFEQLIESAPLLADSVLTLIHARALGASVPMHKLVGLLERTDSIETWGGFAWLGEVEATWVIEHRPDLVVSLADPLLAHVPHRAIPFCSPQPREIDVNSTLTLIILCVNLRTG